MRLLVGMLLLAVVVLTGCSEDEGSIIILDGTRNLTVETTITIYNGSIVNLTNNNTIIISNATVNCTVSGGTNKIATCQREDNTTYSFSWTDLTGGSSNPYPTDIVVYGDSQKFLNLTLSDGSKLQANWTDSGGLVSSSNGLFLYHIDDCGGGSCGFLLHQDYS